jgi:hypothetical protein
MFQETILILELFYLLIPPGHYLRCAFGFKLQSEKPPQFPPPQNLKLRSHTSRLGRATQQGPLGNIHHTQEPAMSEEDLRAELEQLRRENDALKKTSAKGLSMKVSEKGALSIYGLGRFPVTLYKEQWTKLLAMAEEIKTFIQANDSQLKAKD